MMGPLLNVLNPFNSQIGQLIERATDGSQECEDWELIIHVCDMISHKEDIVKDAIRSFKKRLQNAKDRNTYMYTLTVIEACVKNCPPNFHASLFNRDFMNELVKLVTPKNNPAVPRDVQEKVLLLIQAWADAFYDKPQYSAVLETYNELKKTYDFPMTNLDTMAPIHTPQRSVPEQVVQCDNRDGREPNLLQQIDTISEQRIMLNELLQILMEREALEFEKETIQKLMASLKTMQDRLRDIIAAGPDQDIIASLLELNDDLNTTFSFYDECVPLLENKKEDVCEMLQSLDIDSEQSPEASNKATSSAQEDVFDMFAQSRKMTYETLKAQGSTYEDNLMSGEQIGNLGVAAQGRSQPQIMAHSESDFSEMEAWLAQEPTTGLSSSDFDQFLSEHTAAARDKRSPKAERKGDKAEKKDEEPAL